MTVHEGVVTLSGGVGSCAERLAAQEAAHRVAGVRDVANEIAVTIPGTHSRTDEDIARAARNALDRSPRARLCDAATVQPDVIRRQNAKFSTV